MHIRGVVTRLGGDDEELYVELEEQRTRRVWNFISYPYNGHQIASFLTPGHVYVLEYSLRGCPPEYDGVITGVSVPDA